tara:strand:+ start:626 stop:1420 length:795 start_codon:yes stop_codon:yes gene_type:complete
LKKKKLFKYRVSKNYKTTKKQNISFLFRKIFFNFFGFILRPIFKFNDSEFGSNIIVLGRGVSSNYYFFNYEKFLKIKDIMMVNFETKDFKKDYKDRFKNKNIFFFTNVNESTPSIRILHNLNISKVLFGRIESMRNTDYGKRKSFKNDILWGKVSYLPNQLIKYWWVNNNGLMGICYAASRKRIKKIYLFGFNFYHSGYMNNSIENEIEPEAPGHSKQLKNARQKLKKNFIKIVKSFPDKKFYIFLYKDLFKKRPSNLIIKIIK